MEDLRKIKEENFEGEITTPPIYLSGASDDNDAVEYNDGFSQKERELIRAVVGGKMQPDRWVNFQELYLSNDVNNIFKTYEDPEHGTTAEMSLEILKFFQTPN